MGGVRRTTEKGEQRKEGPVTFSVNKTKENQRRGEGEEKGEGETYSSSVHPLLRGALRE